MQIQDDTIKVVKGTENQHTHWEYIADVKLMSHIVNAISVEVILLLLSIFVLLLLLNVMLNMLKILQ